MNDELIIKSIDSHCPNIILASKGAYSVENYNPNTPYIVFIQEGCKYNFPCEGWGVTPSQLHFMPILEYLSGCSQDTTQIIEFIKTNPTIYMTL